MGDPLPLSVPITTQPQAIKITCLNNISVVNLFLIGILLVWKFYRVTCHLLVCDISIFLAQWIRKSELFAWVRKEHLAHVILTSLSRKDSSLLI